MNKLTVAIIAGCLVSGCSSDYGMHAAGTNAPGVTSVRLAEGDEWNKSVVSAEIVGLRKADKTFRPRLDRALLLTGLQSDSITDARYHLLVTFAFPEDNEGGVENQAEALGGPDGSGDADPDEIALEDGAPKSYAGAAPQHAKALYQVVDVYERELVYSMETALPDRDDLSGQEMNDSIREFMSSFARAKRLPIYQVLPCRSDPQLEEYKLSLMKQGMRFRTESCE